MVENNPLFAHIIAQTRQNVELLMAHKQISESDGQAILSRLAADSSLSSLTKRTQNMNISSGPPKVEARAIWGWAGQDLKDLSIREGDIIEIIAETNPDWWKGRNRSGREGLFPSNFVEKLAPRSDSRGPGVQRYASPALQHPPPPGPPSYAAAPPQAHYPPPAGPYYSPPPGPPPAGYSYAPPAGPPAQPAPQQAPAGNSGGGMGTLLAESATSGVGFGAGSAVGGGLIRSLFS